MYIFHQLFIPILNVGCTFRAHHTQIIIYNISFTWMVVNVYVHSPSTVPTISADIDSSLLCESVLETIVVCQHIHMHSIQVVPP